MGTPTIVNDAVYLASQSPRRKILLSQLGIDFEVLDTLDVDETPRPDEAVGEYVERLARAKATAGQATLPDEVIVLGADTTVAVDGAILGKPSGPDEARSHLRRLSGRTHDVYSGVAVSAGSVNALVSASRVRFRPLSDAEIAWYWRTGEPRDKAGSYAIQGLGAMFIEHLEGSYSEIGRAHV